MGEDIVRRIALFLVWFLLLTSLGMAEDIWNLDFESAGGYNTSVTEFSEDNYDYFIRTDGSNIGGVSFTNIQGSWYFAAQDIDGEVATLPVTLTIDDIDISGFSDLEFSVYLAEDDASDSNQDWDAADYVHIDYDIDNSGSFTNLIWVEAEDGTNTAPKIDTDFDGVGDGTEITDAFVQFTNSISGTGSLIDIKVTFDLDDGDTDISIDDLRITGTPQVNNPISFSIQYITSDKMSLSWTEPVGTYDKVLVFGRSGTAVNHSPSGAGSGYSDVNAAWGSAGTYSTDNKLLYSGRETSVTVTGLSEGTDYYFKAYAYDDDSWSSGTGDVNDVAEVQGTSDFAASAIIGNEQIDLSWTNYSGAQSIWWDEVLILTKSGSPVDGSPTGDGSSYTANSVFGSGTEVDTGNYVVYKGTGTSETVTNLTNGITYYFRAFVRDGSDWTDSDEYESVNATTYATIQDANRKIRITEKDADDLVAGSNKCFIVDVEFLDKYGDVTGDTTTSVSFNAWLNAAGTTAGNGVLTKMKRTTSGSKQTFELKYTKAEAVYLEAVAGSIDSVGQTDDNFPATVTAADPANIHVSLSKTEFTVDKYTIMYITVVDAYSNAVDDSEEVWFDLGGRGLISSGTSREAISEPVSLDAYGKGKVYYHPSRYYTGSQDIIVYWDGNNNGEDDGYTGESAVVETKSVTINPEELAQVVLEVTGSAQGLTGEVNQAVTDTVGTTTDLLAELQDIYGNHIDAAISDVAFSYGDSTNGTVSGTALNSDKNIVTNFEVSHVLRSINKVDSVIVTTTTGGYTSVVEITQFSKGPLTFTVGTDTAYVAANDSILIAGNTASNPDSIIYFGLKDEYGNNVEQSYKIKYSTNGDGKFANGKSDTTVAVGDAGTSGSGLEFFAGTLAGPQIITATYGSISDDFTINVLPAAPDSVSLIPELIEGLSAGATSEKLIAKVYDQYGNYTIAGDTLFTVAPTFAKTDTNLVAVGQGTVSDVDTTADKDHFVTYTAWEGGFDSSSVYVKLPNDAADTTVIISVENLDLASFEEVVAPKDTIVGKWLTITFDAKDIDGNRKYNYQDSVVVTLDNSAATGNQVIWQDATMGGLVAEAEKDTALEVNAYFEKGRLKLKLYDEVTESGLTITVKNVAETIIGTSAEFGFKAAAVDSLPITITDIDNIFAGYEFEFTVTPKDTFGNVNTTQEVKFYMTANYPDELNLSSGARFITGPETYTITPNAARESQYLRIIDAVTVADTIAVTKGGLSLPFNVQPKIVAIDDDIKIPEEYALNQNCPNPFNPTTMISFALPEAGDVKLVVYNIFGQQVAELQNGYLQPGYYNFNFSAHDLASGIYIYRIQANNFTDLKKMTILK